MEEMVGYINSSKGFQASLSKVVLPDITFCDDSALSNMGVTSHTWLLST